MRFLRRYASWSAPCRYALISDFDLNGDRRVVSEGSPVNLTGTSLLIFCTRRIVTGIFSLYLVARDSQVFQHIANVIFRGITPKRRNTDRLSERLSPCH